MYLPFVSVTNFKFQKTFGDREMETNESERGVKKMSFFVVVVPWFKEVRMYLCPFTIGSWDYVSWTIHSTFPISIKTIYGKRENELKTILKTNTMSGEFGPCSQIFWLSVCMFLFTPPKQLTLISLNFEGLFPLGCKWF